ncbi:SAM-dependent methyltransferase [Solicola gregarius]|uniref:Cyclopropane-fatty-acyl-phospholipid synthase family protein n=1 Tax=Solicola gregarius TaxID=2908642 RepID=A0AA46TGD1_9ACTN|nr:cyclopropane-fatty-acyl-phospholipid synthase family protein [Solicola gregarius]UYM04611.1 cyclopropane-fatty-acyl-phospholipid synthase family protein [Solicola gregarius]
MTTDTSLAPTVHRAVSAVLGADLPVGIRAWDGSAYGSGPATLVLDSPEAVRHIVWHPGELGLARAYVSGSLDVEGDLADALRLTRVALEGRPALPGALVRASSEVTSMLRKLAAHGAFERPPAAPPEEARLGGRLHSLRRDREAIHHHYDLGNDFYETLLDDTMAYSCGLWAHGHEDPPTIADSAKASSAKLDRVCRKLGLQPGMRLLDVGCGWGSLLVHAATCYGVRASGITLSREQASYARERIDRLGLSDRVTVEVRDYRDLAIRGVDAVASIEMGEHVGRRQYPRYLAAMRRTLRPGGRVLLQQMSRTQRSGGGAFIESYIAPDMHMRPLDETCAMMRRAGLEIRDVMSMREHYVLTARAWARNLEDNWSSVVELAGERTARIWRLYLAGGSLAFADNRMGVDQILAVRPRPDGRSDIAATDA